MEGWAMRNERRKHKSVRIRRSCITDEAVWIFQGAPGGERMAYSRAARMEIRRMARFGEVLARRRENISGLLEDCLSAIPEGAVLTPVQQDAVRQLQALIRKEPECHSGFYDHIMEERRRRAEDREIRRRMRERDELSRTAIMVNKEI